MGQHFAFIILLGLISPNAAYHAQHNPDSPSAQSSQSSVTTLSFKEFFELERGELKPSARLLALNGKHVRLIGFMVQMENSPLGAFYLCEHPVFCDEEGGGTADLPPESVLVLVSSYSGQDHLIHTRRPGGNWHFRIRQERRARRPHFIHQTNPGQTNRRAGPLKLSLKEVTEFVSSQFGSV